MADAPRSPARGPDGPVWCVVVAGGSGTRFGGAKQFAEIAGRRVLDLAVSAAASACDGVVVVVPADTLGSRDAEVPAADLVVAGGASRTESTHAGIAAVPLEAAVVLVHDAARPLAGPELFTRVIEAVRSGADAVVPVVAVSDTMRSLDGAVVDRDRLRAVQTPQGFRAATLRAAHDDANATGAEATDDAGLVEAGGTSVVLVDGDPTNLKLTGPADLAVAEVLLASRSHDVPAEANG